MPGEGTSTVVTTDSVCRGVLLLMFELLAAELI
jgi:hypothetical protein